MEANTFWQENTAAIVTALAFLISFFFFFLPPFKAFQKLPSSSPRLMRILERLTLLSPGDLIPYAEALTSSMALLLEPAVPRRILQTVNKLWISLNTVMPRRYMLWIFLDVVSCYSVFGDAQ